MIHASRMNQRGGSRAFPGFAALILVGIYKSIERKARRRLVMGPAGGPGRVAASRLRL